MQVEATKVETIAAEALLTAADTIERWADNEEAHYEGTDDTAYIGVQETFNRAFNVAYEHNIEANTSGEKFDRVEDLFSKPMTDALEVGLSGKSAATLYKNRARELIN